MTHQHNITLTHTIDSHCSLKETRLRIYSARDYLIKETKNGIIKAACAFICAAVLAAGLTSCNSETDDSKSLDKQLLTFGFTDSANDALSTDVTGTVDQSAHTVAVTVPYGTTVTALVATFTCSDGASVTVGSTAQSAVHQGASYSSSFLPLHLFFSVFVYILGTR